MTVPSLTGQSSLLRYPDIRRATLDACLLAEGDAVIPGQLDYVAMAQRQASALTSPLGAGDACWERPFIHGLGFPDLAWSQAALGCEVRVVGGTTWAQPFAGSCAEAAARWEAVLPIWEAELRRAAAAYAAEAAGRAPVGGPVMRGPLDMAASALGETAMCLAAADEPEALARLLDVCMAVFLRLSAAWQTSVPPWHGGWLPYAKWGLWAPGPTVARMQNDAAVLMSPAFYRRYLTPLDERIAQQYEFSVYHMHSGAIHALPGILANRWLDVVQIQLDPPPGGPPLTRLMGAFADVQAAGKGLLICGPMTEAEVGTLVDALSPIGLCIQAEETVG